MKLKKRMERNHCSNILSLGSTTFRGIHMWIDRFPKDLLPPCNIESGSDLTSTPRSTKRGKSRRDESDGKITRRAGWQDNETEATFSRSWGDVFTILIRPASIPNRPRIGEIWKCTQKEIY